MPPSETTRVVEINWPKVANSDNHSWDVHQGLPDRMRRQAAPMLDTGLSALIQDMDERGLLSETIVIAVGEFGRSPLRGISTSGNSNSADGRDHWPYCYTGIVAGAGVRRGHVHGRSDATASAPLEGAVHPRELLATIYHALGIDSSSGYRDHLNRRAVSSTTYPPPWQSWSTCRRAPTATSRQPWPAPTIMCFVPGGQCTKSHCCRVRS